MHRRMFRTLLLVLTLSLATAAMPSRADEGMWLLNRPPVKLLQQRYGFEPKAEWLQHLQKSCVRFNLGGSGSIVSPDGLVVTNHHVGSDVLEKLSTPDRNLLEDGFLAAKREDELKCPDLELNVLWEIEDVTERVTAAATAGMSAADANTARRKAIITIEEEAEKKSGMDCQVVTLYQGARYHLYHYQRFADVRLVMAPERQIAFFGGDNDNFEYPRFDLDMCFFRIYENDRPLKTEHYLKWSAAGAKDGELIFVLGHPGRTQRQNTVDHLRFLRDVHLPTHLNNLWRREVQLAVFMGRGEENRRIALEEYFGVQNSRKAYTGMMEGLHDPELMRKKVADEKTLRSTVAADPENARKWGEAWDRLAEAMGRYREFYVRYRLQAALSRCRLFDVARHLVRLADEKPKPNAERLPEYSDSELDSLYQQLYSPAPLYDELEIDRLASALSLFAEMLGGDDPTVVRILDGRSPRHRAEQLVRGARIKDVAERRKLGEGGKEAIAACDDAMIRFAASVDAEARALRKRYEDEIEAVQRASYAAIAEARFARYGEDMYPDATFTLRLAFGTIRGYEENGRRIPAFTDFAGLYQRHKERGGVAPFDLPDRWLERKDKLNPATPYNFVCTADIIGGNSGSPVVNKAGEVVGLIFDGNIQSLVFDFIYTEEEARAVAVDSRAIIEALKTMYDAPWLVKELTGTK